MIATLLSLHIEAFVVSGKVAPFLLNACREKHILILQNISVDILESFAALSGASIVGDIEQLETPYLGQAVCNNLQIGTRRQ